MNQEDTEKHKEDSKNTRKNPNPSAQFVILLKNLKKIIYKKEHPRTHVPETDKVVQQARTLNRITITLVVVNLFLAIGTFLLWNEAVNQSHVAENSAKLQENFTKKDIRAYVGYGIQNLTFTRKEGIRCDEKIFNAGKSPARFVFNVSGMAVDTGNEIDSLFTVLNGALDRHGKAGDILLTTNSSDPLTSIQSTLAFLGGKPLTLRDSLFYREAMIHNRFVVFGDIQYFDIFDEKHTTTYCLVVNAITGKSYPYHKYNDAN